MSSYLYSDDLRDLDDIDELTEEASRTIRMLLNESTNRDKYDRWNYISQCRDIIRVVAERVDALPDEE